MKKSDFKELSIRGRVAYCIKCLVTYIKAKYPNGKLEPIIEKACHIIDKTDCIDESAHRYMEIIPEYLFEFDNFVRLDFEYMDEEEYKLFISLIPNPKVDEDLNNLMHYIYDVAIEYCYVALDKGAPETLSYIMKTVDILKKNKLEIPSIEQFKKFKFEEFDGWGDYIEKEEFL